jgi:FdhD protein
MDGRKANRTRRRVTAVEGEKATRRSDWLATEEPLEIRVADAATLEPILTHVTMRTPGADFELAAGFLLAEGVVGRADQIRQMEFCVGPLATNVQNYNIVSVEVRDVDPERRAGAHFRTAISACGVCGKASLDELSMRGVERLADDTQIEQDVIQSLPDKLRKGQTLFASTGGLHGAALFTSEGDLLAVREDVGRHNAVDKLLGWSLLNAEKARDRAILMVSGRQSYELAQKAVVGRIPVLAGVSAPSSLSVELADEFGLTLIGFLRGESFNLYAGHQRVNLRAAAGRRAS